VILLASGGRVAYAGPASTVFSKLEKKNWAEVFKFLASPDATLLASRKRDVAISTEVQENHVLQRRQGFLKQILTLSSRYIRVIASDRFYLALLTLIPIIIGVISYLAGSKYGFGPGYKTKTGLVYNPFAQGSILVLILGSIFVGLSTSIQEVIKENAVRKREQSVGIRVSTYLASKVLVLVTGAYYADADNGTALGIKMALLRGATTIWDGGSNTHYWQVLVGVKNQMNLNYLDSPNTTSATTYKIQGAEQIEANHTMVWQESSQPSVITLLEIGA
jgi:hypothetical protein